MSAPAGRPRRHVLPYLLGLPVVMLLGVAMVSAVLGLPAGPQGLTREVAARLDESGVRHPVTAVLLNLRAYDTWLEIVALLIAAVATLTTGASALPARSGEPVGAVVSGLARRLLPVIVLVGVFVLALGTFTSGGAFQAGSLVAAGLFLLYLAGVPLARPLAGRGGAVLLVTGTVAFLVAALATLVRGLHSLDFEPGWAGAAIVAIEVAVTASIVVTLVVLLIAAAPGEDTGRGGPSR